MDQKELNWEYSQTKYWRKTTFNRIQWTKLYQTAVKNELKQTKLQFVK